MKFAVQREGATIRLTDEQFYLAVLGIIAGCTAAVMTSCALVLHRNFLTIACDSAVLQSAIINTLHGHWFANNGPGGPNIVGSHTTFLLLLTIPFYIVSPSIDTLFMLQVVGVYSTPIPLYLVASRMLRNPFAAFCVGLAALASPILIHMALAPLHFETWIAATALWSYYFYLRNSPVGFWISFAVAVCCAEQAALLYVGLGLALLLTNDGFAWRKRYGVGALVAGIVWMLLAVFLITPWFRGSHGASSFNIFAYNYTEWKIKNLSELPMAVVHRPDMAFHLLTHPVRWTHIGALIGLPLIAAFFSWRSFLLLAPAPLYLLMCDQEFFLYFHAYYYSFAFFAGYIGFVILLSRPFLTKRVRTVLITGLMFTNVLLFCNASILYSQLAAYRDPFTDELHNVFAQIPQEATVYTPHRYSAYLSNRENFVIGDLRDRDLNFNAMINARFDDTHIRPEQIDYIVSDYLTDQCGWRGNDQDSGMYQIRNENIDALLQSGQWKVFWSGNNVVILKRIGE